MGKTKKELEVEVAVYKYWLEFVTYKTGEKGQAFTLLQAAKAMKALEIIKERQVDVGLLLDCETEPEYLNRCCNRYWHNEKCGWKRLSQEEYDLLKEVLSDYEK